jgi:hypothetical protein
MIQIATVLVVYYCFFNQLVDVFYNYMHYY